MRISPLVGGKGKLCQIDPSETAGIELAGSGELGHIWLCLSPARLAAWRSIKDLVKNPDFYRKVHLEISVDDWDVPLVSVPCSDFFLCGHGVVENVCTPPIEVVRVPPLRMPPAQGSFNCHIPMRFREGLSLCLRNDNEGPMVVEGNLYWNEFKPDPDPIPYFGAQYIERETMGQPFQLADLGNPAGGTFWGLSLYVENHDRENRWHEAPVQLTVDGQDWPAAMACSGAETFFGDCWGFRRTFGRPRYGVTCARPFGRRLIDGGRFNPAGRFCAYRFLDTVAAPFERSLQVRLGRRDGVVLPTAEVSGKYRSVSYCWLNR